MRALRVPAHGSYVRTHDTIIPYGKRAGGTALGRLLTHTHTYTFTRCAYATATLRSPPLAFHPRRHISCAALYQLHRASLTRRRRRTHRAAVHGAAPSGSAVSPVGRGRGEAGDERRMLALQCRRSRVGPFGCESPQRSRKGFPRLTRSLLRRLGLAAQQLGRSGWERRRLAFDAARSPLPRVCAKEPR